VCTEMPVVPVYGVVDKKRIIEKMVKQGTFYVLVGFDLTTRKPLSDTDRINPICAGKCHMTVYTNSDFLSLLVA
jgi:hypothetical protein